MLVPQFKIKRARDGRHSWIATSQYERDKCYRGFTAVGKNLSDLKQWVDIVRLAERTGKLEELGAMVDELERKTGIQSTWGGTWYHSWHSIYLP